MPASQPGGEWLSEWTEDPAMAIASVTRIEALGFPGISPQEEEAIRDFLASSICYSLDDAVIDRTIGLRQKRKMGTMDSIIAATALEYDVTLVTRNVDDFKNVENLKIVNPFASRETS